MDGEIKVNISWFVRSVTLVFWNIYIRRFMFKLINHRKPFGLRLCFLFSTPLGDSYFH